ncbi:MAG TPA: hypothetical protein VF857_03150 [Spirochaetota bacterium]
MPFVRIEGEEGLFFVPEESETKKHPCPDCYSCQWCADERCALCLKRAKCISCVDNPSETKEKRGDEK